METAPNSPFTVDRNGSRVVVGTLVKVVFIPPSVVEQLSAEEAERVQAMLGEELPVYEVDAWGRGWVEKWWHESEDRATSHSLALAPLEMEVVSNDA